MQPDTVRKLLRLNQEFYQTFAQEFSATRQRLQPGVARLIENLPPGARILDLGCGNGTLWQGLIQSGHQGRYVGLDASPGLVAEARRKNPEPARGEFQCRDLSAPGWEADLPAPFDFVFALAVLHHLPGQDLRRETCRKIHNLLGAEGKFILSNWQFLNSPRWRARVQPWEQVGLTSEEVEPGDTLLDWRRGGTGFRYVHHFEERELARLAAETGFRVVDSFTSDGKEGNLGLYQIWEVM